MPDGSDQLQYISKVSSVANDGTPTTGSVIPTHIDTNVSTMLSFDPHGHFIRAWSNSKTHKVNSAPANMGNLQQGDMMRSDGG